MLQALTPAPLRRCQLAGFGECCIHSVIFWALVIWSLSSARWIGTPLVLIGVSAIWWGVWGFLVWALSGFPAWWRVRPLGPGARANMQQLTATEVVAPAAVSRCVGNLSVGGGLGRALRGCRRFGIAAVGTMMCAYFVPFHITHGPPVLDPSERHRDDCGRSGGS